MKKIILLSMLLSVQLIYALVDTRLVYVSNTHDFPSAGLSTLVFDVEAISTAGDVLINVYQNAVQLDENFRTQNPTILFSNQLFPPASYSTTQDYRSSDGRIRFVYAYSSGTRGKVLGTYTRVVTISIEYITAASTGTISWFSGLPSYSVADGGNNIITGTRLTIPSELSAIPLPVEITSFTSKLLSDKVQLNWVTKTEVNNYGFNVERRVNEGEWKKIGFVEGNGTTTESKEYSYSDKDIYTGGNKFQYRLKQIDNDGSFEYTDVIEVEIVPAQFELFQNYPNPFNPSTTIRFSLPEQTQLKIKIYNMLGELVDTLVDGTFDAGYHKVAFDASNLSSGAYIYRIESPAFVQVKKMVLIK
jgi:hypothetical protein